MRCHVLEPRLDRSQELTPIQFAAAFRDADEVPILAIVRVLACGQRNRRHTLEGEHLGNELGSFELPAKDPTDSLPPSGSRRWRGGSGLML